MLINKKYQNKVIYHFYNKQKNQEYNYNKINLLLQQSLFQINKNKEAHQLIKIKKIKKIKKNKNYKDKEKNNNYKHN